MHTVSMKSRIRGAGTVQVNNCDQSLVL